MISHQHKYLFVHIPKVAGESIERYLLEVLGLTWSDRAGFLIRRNLDPNLGPPRLAHLLASEYLKYGYLKQPDFKKYFKFSFVRNPWDRLVSEFFFNHVGYMDFKSFILKTFPTTKDDDYYTGSDKYRHVIPQYDFLHDEQGDILVEYVGRYESLNSDFAEVCRRLNLPVLPLKIVNSFKQIIASRVLAQEKLKTGQKVDTLKPHYSRFYDAETREWVEDMYSKDINTFNYCFESDP